MPTVADVFGNLTVLTVDPALDRRESEAFRARVTDQIQAGRRWFVLDGSHCTRLDSRGLEDLLWLQEQVEAVGGVVKIAGLRGTCCTIFRLVRFDRKFEVFDGVPEAVSQFA